MRRCLTRAILLFLSLWSSEYLVLAQGPAPRQQVTVIVVNALPHPPQPVKAVSVSVMFQDVTAARGVTNSQGQVRLEISFGSAQAGGLHLAIAGAGDLVIYQPASGDLIGLTGTIPVRLLPKGSPALLEPVQIQAMLQRASVEINSLQKQVTALKQGASSAQNQRPDLGAAIADWALANGFSAEQVNKLVQQWAEGIQKQSDQATAEQKALAELALKHYDAAAQLFNQASDADKQQLSADDAQEQNLEAQVKALQAAQLALLDKARTSLRQLLDHSQQAASADQLDLRFHEATQTVESAEVAAEAEYKKHTDDIGFHELWLRAGSAAAGARAQEGEVSPASQSLPLLAQSADNLELIAREYSALGDRAEAASAQSALGVTLIEEGKRGGGDKAMALLDQAVAAFRSALEVNSKASQPENWALLQIDLGIALMDEGERATGDKAMTLLDQALKAHRSALEVFTKADHPQDWARTEVLLGEVLMNEGERASGDKAMTLLDQAVEADQSALQVLTKADQPENWASAQIDLGGALMREGERATGDKAMALLDQAIAAYRSALEVPTQASLPQDWARIQVDLGIALMDEGERATGDKAMTLLDQALKAHRSALEVYTKADLPQDWARSQVDLGNTLMDEAERTVGDNATALLDQAGQAYRGALEIYTKAELPQDWALAQNNLGNALMREGELVSDDKAIAFFDQAAQAFQNALQVYTQAELPQLWAVTQMNLGAVLMCEGERATGDKALALLDQAIQAYRSVLEAVRTKATLPQDWAITEVNLGSALVVEGERATGDKALGLLDQAIQAYQGALEVYTRAEFPQDWARTESSLGEVLDDEGERATGDKAKALLDQAVITERNALEVYTKVNLPQDWARTEVRLGVALTDEGQRASGDQSLALIGQAVEAFRRALEVQTDSTAILQEIANLDHDFLFRYDDALQLDQLRIKIDPSPPSKLELIEASLTAERFDDCAQLAGVLADDGLAPADLLVRNTFNLACEWASGNKSAALSAVKSVSSTAASAEKGRWNFAGTLHFLAIAPKFATGRTSWIALFTAIQNGDSAGIATALQQLEPILHE